MAAQVEMAWTFEILQKHEIGIIVFGDTECDKNYTNIQSMGAKEVHVYILL